MSHQSDLLSGSDKAIVVELVADAISAEWVGGCSGPELDEIAAAISKLLAAAALGALEGAGWRLLPPAATASQGAV